MSFPSTNLSHSLSSGPLHRSFSEPEMLLSCISTQSTRVSVTPSRKHPCLAISVKGSCQGFCTPSVSLSLLQQSLSPSIFKTTSSLNLGIVSYPFPWQHTWHRIGTQLRLEKSISCQEPCGQRILDQQGTHSQEGEECRCAGTRGHQP